MTTNFADRLLDAVRDKKVPACVGLDPMIGRLPRAVLEEYGRPDRSTDRDPSASKRAAGAILAYGREVIQIIAPHVPAIKINIAFFEPYYAEGISAYFQLVHEANRAKVPVVAMCDTNANPDVIDYPVPSNDDAIRAIQLMTGRIADAVLEGIAVGEVEQQQRRAGRLAPSHHSVDQPNAST